MNKTRGIYEELKPYRNFDYDGFFSGLADKDIQTILAKDQLTALDYLALLSPAAEKYLEPMAQKAKAITLKYFGKTILLFTPIYLSDYCTNKCKYCGFSALNTQPRKMLTLEQVEQEAQVIASTGLKHILYLTGDAPTISSVQYMKNCTKILTKYFSSVGTEVYSLTLEEYKELYEAGVDSMTMFQETYNEALYDDIHVAGPKKDYHFRLDAPERACQAGMWCVNIGALMGLDEWRREAFFTGLHAAYLQDHYPEVDINISVPRMRPHTGDFQPLVDMTDMNTVQYILAYRLFMQRSGITMSTRETVDFRNHMMGIGVTKMSAGSCTAVGGHIHKNANSGQFDISDERDVEEMKKAIRQQGFQPVMKNWEPLVGES
ncbi:2-iminoacetate synthase [Sporomusaceae bacterium BoRhaA]|uniref:2-iminoacetate synthase ThiH n=1 Tax=Pelorhabdus rhamnosifermentans TaxID=2772457 RepID=UPI001C062E97|nr:2-iminoacetate synthase ThiH [Pelorhabdus rhamnosifermentans]MBU2701447.1 2-iminoacetate synthase [Pelorhabdus rhamnosifermentans]